MARYRDWESSYCEPVRSAATFCIHVSTVPQDEDVYLPVTVTVRDAPLSSQNSCSLTGVSGQPNGSQGFWYDMLSFSMVPRL